MSKKRDPIGLHPAKKVHEHQIQGVAIKRKNSCPVYGKHRFILSVSSADWRYQCACGVLK